jgi:hypothetical protein
MTMAYLEVYTVVEGAVDREATFGDSVENQGAYDQFIHEAEQAFQQDGLETDIFEIFHEHEEGVGCECVQYLTDHHPQYHFPARG